MKRFVVPPNWPNPPRRSWTPPRTWRPDPSWPPAPKDWQFWDDGKGNPVRGPIGRYGGPSRLLVFGGAGAAMAFLAVNLWALSAIGLFDGKGAETQAGPVVDDASPTPSVVSQRPSTKLPPPRSTTTTTPPRVPTATRTTERATRTVEPTRTTRTPRRTEAPEPERPSATTTTTTRTTRPPSTRPTRTGMPTQEELARAYCRQQGWPEHWCDPDNWRTTSPSHRPRR